MSVIVHHQGTEIQRRDAEFLVLILSILLILSIFGGVAMS